MDVKNIIVLLYDEKWVDDFIKWYKIDEVDRMIARKNNCSGMHWDKCREFLWIFHLKNGNWI